METCLSNIADSSLQECRKLPTINSNSGFKLYGNLLYKENILIARLIESNTHFFKFICFDSIYHKENDLIQINL